VSEAGFRTPVTGPDLRVPVPRYGESALSDLLPSVLAALGVPGEEGTLALKPVRRACVLLVDGLGWELLRAHQDQAPFLASLLPDGRPLTAGFPATTVASLGSLGTGLPPGAHGLVGYQVALPGTDRLMNLLRWDASIDPVVWQPHRTVFDRAEAAGVAASQVAPGAFENSGFTVAVLRGGRYVPAESPGERVARAVEALSAAERSLVYVYYSDLDATGHRSGCGSEAWALQLGHADRLAEQLAERLPAGAVLYVTGDHGTVDVPPELRRDFDTEPALSSGVRLLGGEARARHVYAVPGAAPDVLAAWRETLGDAFWVSSREQAVTGGWFGAHIPDVVLPRIGDVVAAARGAGAVVATRTEPNESQQVGMHGSMVAAEQLVPLLTVRR
jgi:hypothetical protein